MRKLKVVFDTNVWRSLGLNGLDELYNYLSNPLNIKTQKVELWEVVPVIFETIYDWHKENKLKVIVEFSKRKIKLCKNRIIPSPTTVVQRAIADKYNLFKNNNILSEENRYYINILNESTKIEFLQDEKFKNALIDPVETAGKGYKEDMERLLNRVKPLLNKTNSDKTDENTIDKLFEQPEIINEMVKVLTERFDLPRKMRPYMALYSEWEELPHTKIILEYYKAKLKDLFIKNRKPREQDFFDLEIMICATRLDKFITQNEKDFQRYNLPSLNNKLWTLDEFKNYIGFDYKKE